MLQMPHNVRPRADLPPKEKKFVADLIRQMHNAGGFCTVKKGLELKSSARCCRRHTKLYIRS